MNLRRIGCCTEDLAFLLRAVDACNYGEDAVTPFQAFQALEAGWMHYYIANHRCGGGVWWKSPEQAWLVLLYREGPERGLREDCRLLKQGMLQSVEAHGHPMRLYAAVDAANPHREGLLLLHRAIFDLKPYQTITRSDWIGK